jgi:Glycosyltransferase family 87
VPVMDLVSRFGNFQRPWLTRAALIIVWAVVLVRYALLLPELPNRTTQYDFSLYYTSALALRTGIDPYFSNLARIGRPLGYALPDPFLTNYTPYFLIAFEPLAAFPIRTAYWLWFSASISALVLAVIILFREYDLAGIPAALSLALILLFPGVIAHFRYAQSQFILLLALVLMLHWLRCNRGGVAGVALAAAIMFKVFPIVIIGYLASRRRWQAIGWTLCTIAIGTILVLPTFGLRDWLQFFKSNGSDPYALSIDNIAPTAFMSRVYWHLFTFHSNPFTRHLLIAGFDAVVLMTAFFGTVHNEALCDLGFSLWLLAMLLVSPLVWLHYLPLLIIPAVQIVSLLSHGYHFDLAVLVMLFAYAMIFILYPVADNLPRHGIAELLSEYGVAALLLIYFSTHFIAQNLQVRHRLCVDPV